MVLSTLWLMSVLLPVQESSTANGPAVERPTAYGLVHRSDGEPIEGATVFVYTAGPKVGTSAY